MNQGPILRVDEILPPEFHHIFPHDHFNEMQSQVIDRIVNSDENVVVAAPTGSGKTVLHEIAICKMMIERKSCRCVYIAPSRALCQQHWLELSEKFAKFQLQVLEVTGDVDFSNSMKNVAQASIIVTTPEKWDSLTRTWRDNVYFLGSVDLLLIDEIHHLGETRGAVLEMVVVRMRLIRENYAHSNHLKENTVRIIALSATLPNIVDVGEWLRCPPSCIFFFDDSYRPVPLRTITMGYDSKSNPFLFERSLDKHLSSLIGRYSAGKSTIIFCSSKKGAENTALHLRKQYNRTIPITSELEDVLNRVQDKRLIDLILHGFAFHHAGLPPDDRMIVEQLFLRNTISVLCSTSTLAHGMNFPAKLVIIKGTLQWRGASKGFEKLKRSDIIQMLGRAGRPGFDHDGGVAVIMTSSDEKQYYSDFSLNADVVESSLLNILPEALVSEISQRVITTIESSVKWLQDTYFYVRARKNPKLLGNTLMSKPDFDEYLTSICLMTIDDLASAGVISVFDNYDHIEPLPEAHIMSKYMIKLNSMKLLMDLPANTTLPQLIKAISFCEELKKPVRRTEKKLLNDLMKSIRYPLNDRVQEPHHKSFVLMQAVVDHTDLKDFSMRIEQAEIVENVSRILKGLHALCITRLRGTLLEACILLERALRIRLWEWNKSCQFMQCQGISMDLKLRLKQNQIHSVSQISGCSVPQVQRLCACTEIEAQTLLRFSAAMLGAQYVASIEEHEDTATIAIKRGDTNARARPVKLAYQLLCYDQTSGQLLYYRKLTGEEDQLQFTFPVSTALSESKSLRCCLLAEVSGVDYCNRFIVTPDDDLAPQKAEEFEKKEDNRSISVKKPLINRKRQMTATNEPAMKKKISTENKAEKDVRLLDNDFMKVKTMPVVKSFDFSQFRYQPAPEKQLANKSSRIVTQDDDVNALNNTVTGSISNAGDITSTHVRKINPLPIRHPTNHLSPTHQPHTLQRQCQSTTSNAQQIKYELWNTIDDASFTSVFF